MATVLNYPVTAGGITSETTLALGTGAASISIQANGHATQVVLDVTGYYNTQTHLIILADGTAWYGSRPHLTSLVHDPNSGLYELTFDRSLDGCNVLTTSNDQRDVQAVGAWGGSTLDVSTSHEVGGSSPHRTRVSSCRSSVDSPAMTACRMPGHRRRAAEVC